MYGAAYGAAYGPGGGCPHSRQGHGRRRGSPGYRVTGSRGEHSFNISHGTGQKHAAGVTEPREEAADRSRRRFREVSLRDDACQCVSLSGAGKGEPGNPLYLKWL